MKNTLLTLSLIFCFAIGGAFAEELTQTVRGKIIDQDSKITLPGASIIILGTDPLLGTSSDMNGSFKFENVPVGRISIQIKFLGYEDRMIPNVTVQSGKETVLEVELLESLVKLDAVEIKAAQNKSEVLNEMALISARAFSVDETKRYAGSFNDPARMVSAFAGVTSDAEGDNNIVVRGNSSKGILWKLEGVDIPNPNHFADEGATGGPINALNSNVLANSDFYTSAFAPEYGNATSGIFDIKLRKGNNEKREYSFSAGVLGIEAAMEGPFAKGSDASYLVNYRYSSLAMLDQAGIVDFDGVPKYQDGTFKFFVPTKKAGTFTLFGLWGKSGILQSNRDSNDRLIEEADYGAQLGTVGLNQLYPISKKMYLKNSIAISQNGSGTDYNEADSNDAMQLEYQDYLNKYSTRAASTLHYKLNAKHKFQLGAVYTHYNYQFESKYRDDETRQMVQLLDEKGNSGAMQNFVSWKYRITKDLTMVSGLHYMHFFLNDANSIEPRAALKWKFAPTQSINAGFGVHSRLESMTAYFAKHTNDAGVVTTPNKNLELGKARHYVIGYENMLSENLMFKTEVYYQDLYNVGVENDSSSNFSLLNTNGWFTNRTLVNQGTGTNYGVEFTLERYFNKGFYFLTTASLYESKYTTFAGETRDTRFNGNYAANFLFGKEFKVGSDKKNKVFGLNTKVFLVGGHRYTPVDLQASILADEEITHEADLFTAKGQDVFQANLTMYYRWDRKKTSHEIKLDIMNVTNNGAITDEYYNSNTQAIGYDRQLEIIPNFYYKIYF